MWKSKRCLSVVVPPAPPPLKTSESHTALVRHTLTPQVQRHHHACSCSPPKVRAKLGSAMKSSCHQFDFNDFDMGPLVGHGSEAMVKKTQHRPTNKTFAFKSFVLRAHHPNHPCGLAGNDEEMQQHGCLSPSSASSSGLLAMHLRNELRHLDHLPHPNVVRYHTVFFAHNHALILMDFATLGSLDSIVRRLGPLSMPTLASLIAQVTSGLAHLHEQCHVVHCDLKPSNLLLDASEGRTTVKISDFGVTVANMGENCLMAHSGDDVELDDEDDTGTNRTTQGSTLYMSPERVRREAFGPSADIWSLGLTCAELAVGVFPLLSGDYGEDDELWDDEMEHENPFLTPVNVFDINTVVADNHASVQWDRLFYLQIEAHHHRHQMSLSQSLSSEEEDGVPLIVGYADVSELCKDFVRVCMQQHPLDRPSATSLTATHPFLALTSVPMSVSFSSSTSSLEQSLPKHESSVDGSIVRTPFGAICVNGNVDQDMVTLSFNSIT